MESIFTAIYKHFPVLIKEGAFSVAHHTVLLVLVEEGVTGWSGSTMSQLAINKRCTKETKALHS